VQFYVHRTCYLPDPRTKSVISNATIVFKLEEALLEVIMASII